MTQTDLVSDTRRLQLVGSSLDPLPEIEGRKLAAGGDRMEIAFEGGCEISVPRVAIAVA